MQVHEGTDESLVLSINVRVQHVSMLGMNMAKRAIKLENTHENPLFIIYFVFAVLKQEM